MLRHADRADILVHGTLVFSVSSLVLYTVFFWEGVPWQKAKSLEFLAQTWTGKEDDSPEYKIAQALASIESPDEQRFEQAVWALEQQGEASAKALMPYLLEEEHSPKAVMNAVYIAGRLGEDAAIAVPELIAKLSSNDMDMRAASARALGKIGAKANESVPALSRLLKDESAWVRESAEKALRAIATPDALRALRADRP